MDLFRFLDGVGQDGFGSSMASFFVNLVTDINKIFSDIWLYAFWVGVILFVVGLIKLGLLKRAGSRSTPMQVACLTIFGTVLTQLGGWADDATKSVWGQSASPADPFSYVSRATELQETSFPAAIIWASLSLIVMLGYIYAFKAIFGLATAGSKQDKTEFVVQRLWMLVGALIMINVLSFAGDVLSSGGVSSTPIIQAG